MRGKLQRYAMEIGSKKKTLKLEYDFILLEIMEKYKWSYEDLQNTPKSFIELAIGKMNLDNKR